MTIRTTFLRRGFRSLVLAALTIMSVGAWAHTELTASEPAVASLSTGTQVDVQQPGAIDERESCQRRQ